MKKKSNILTAPVSSLLAVFAAECLPRRVCFLPARRTSVGPFQILHPLIAYPRITCHRRFSRNKTHDKTRSPPAQRFLSSSRIRYYYLYLYGRQSNKYVIAAVYPFKRIIVRLWRRGISAVCVRISIGSASTQTKFAYRRRVLLLL